MKSQGRISKRERHQQRAKEMESRARLDRCEIAGTGEQKDSASEWPQKAHRVHPHEWHRDPMLEMDALQ